MAKREKIERIQAIIYLAKESGIEVTLQETKSHGGTITFKGEWPITHLLLTKKEYSIIKTYIYNGKN
jgi:hypothetical protein